MKNKKITASLEDYLETIYNIAKEKPVVKAIEIANSLDVRKSSVTEALQNLSKKELIHYAPYEPITLTEKGITLAKAIVKKHQMLADFFEQVLGLETTDALENACRIEHVISESLYVKMVNFTQLIETYSKNNPEFKNTLKKI